MTTRRNHWVTPEILELVRQFRRDNPGRAGHVSIRRMLFDELGILQTSGAIAGMLHRSGMVGNYEGWLERDRANEEARQRNRPARVRSMLPPLPSEMAAAAPREVAAEVPRRVVPVMTPEKPKPVAARSRPVKPIIAVRPVIVAPKPVPPPPSPFSDRVYRPVAPKPEPVAKYGRVIACQTVTDPGKFGIGITFCSEPSSPGRVYCAACCAKYYMPLGRRRDHEERGDAA